MAAPPVMDRDDLLGEILLRIPPDEPAHLVWTSLVCKPWYRILSDRAFLRRYRAFHGAPPLLGFLHNLDLDDAAASRFVSATASAASTCSQSAFGCSSWWALDCRHGRVLLHALGPMGLVVWDPVTGDQQRLPLPKVPHAYCTGTVLCAAAGCDHLDCRRGPFLIVFVGTNPSDGVTWASEYSSRTGAWTAPTFIDTHVAFVEMKPSLLAGGALYFALDDCHAILRYDLGARALSIVVADAEGMGSFMPAEDGGLSYAAEDGYGLCLWSWQINGEGLWSWQINGEGASEWVQSRVVELDKLLLVPDVSHSYDVIGFAEGTGFIFINIDQGVFMVKLKSGEVRRLGDGGAYYAILPYMSFCTPDHA